MTVYRRDPKIPWRREAHAEAEARAALAGDGAAPETAAALGTVTLVAGGRMVQLNLVGGEIWDLVDGARDERAIVAALAERFDAPSETLARDVGGFLGSLALQGWIHAVVATRDPAHVGAGHAPPAGDARVAPTSTRGR